MPSDLAHVKSPEHHQAVAKWYVEQRNWVPVTEGTCESMGKLLKKLIQEEKDELRSQGEIDGCPVRSLTRKIKTSAHFQDASKWEIVDYLQKYASTRFKDNEECKLTGRLSSAMARNNIDNLLIAVDRLNQAWQDALKKFDYRMRDPQSAPPPEDDDDEMEIVDEEAFVRRLTEEMAEFHITTAIDEEADASVV